LRIGDVGRDIAPIEERRRLRETDGWELDVVVKHGRGEQDVEQEIGCEQFKLIVNSYHMLPRASYSSMLYPIFLHPTLSGTTHAWNYPRL
jgi:hypothetical protein